MHMGTFTGKMKAGKYIGPEASVSSLIKKVVESSKTSEREG